MDFETFSERRLKYVTGLLIRAVVCAVFGAVFALNAYLAPPDVRPHFLCAILILIGLASLNAPLWLIGKWAAFPLRHFYGHWLVDLLAVTAVLHVLGGVELPYGSVGYMIMILTSAVFLSERASFVVAGASAVCFDGLVAAEYFSIVPRYVYIWAHDYSGTAQLFIVLASDVFFFLFAYLAGSLAEQLKRA
ncbi:MAG: hypothetical protein QOD06_866, partial [Candidatus Binatota bacterium]|nr:hypothetical protein [Candidatus Binatota bacterium]